MLYRLECCESHYVSCEVRVHDQKQGIEQAIVMKTYPISLAVIGLAIFAVVTSWSQEVTFAKTPLLSSHSVLISMTVAPGRDPGVLPPSDRTLLETLALAHLSNQGYAVIPGTVTLGSTRPPTARVHAMARRKDGDLVHVTVVLEWVGDQWKVKQVNTLCCGPH